VRVADEKQEGFVGVPRAGHGRANALFADKSVALITAF
jgi:hypothetical protein